jgi:hypothetical protein
MVVDTDLANLSEHSVNYTERSVNFRERSVNFREHTSALFRLAIANCRNPMLCDINNTKTFSTISIVLKPAYVGATE